MRSLRFLLLQPLLCMPCLCPCLDTEEVDLIVEFVGRKFNQVYPILPRFGKLLVVGCLYAGNIYIYIYVKYQKFGVKPL